MAMITCRECGKQISDTADICPHCGAKVNQITVKSSASSKHLIIYATLIILGRRCLSRLPEQQVLVFLWQTETRRSLYDDILGPQLSFPAELRVLFSLKHIKEAPTFHWKSRGLLLRSWEQIAYPWKIARSESPKSVANFSVAFHKDSWNNFDIVVCSRWCCCQGLM